MKEASLFVEVFRNFDARGHVGNVAFRENCPAGRLVFDLYLALLQIPLVVRQRLLILLLDLEGSCPIWEENSVEDVVFRKLLLTVVREEYAIYLCAHDLEVVSKDGLIWLESVECLCDSELLGVQGDATPWCHGLEIDELPCRGEFEEAVW